MPDAPPIDGTWEITIESPGGVREARLVVERDGRDISGAIIDASGPTDIRGSVSDGEIEFVAAAPGVSGPLVMTFFGEVEGDRLTGGVDFGELGTGSWTGRRA